MREWLVYMILTTTKEKYQHAESSCSLCTVEWGHQPRILLTFIKVYLILQTSDYTDFIKFTLAADFLSQVHKVFMVSPEFTWPLGRLSQVSELREI